MKNTWHHDVTKASIMIVDDQPTNLTLLDRMLRRVGYGQLTLVQDSREFMCRYQLHRPDLILLDLQMPYFDGFDLLEQLASLNETILPPVVVLTAQSGRDCRLRALEAGARDFLIKPFDISELRARVRNLLEAHLAHRMMYDQRNVLDEMVRHQTKELLDTRLQIIERLGNAAEYRDNETGMHITRMSQYSRIIAEAMGWGGERCDLMLHASPMHDIGKLGVPDSILLKPGPLTGAEFAVIKRHPEIGAKLLGGDSSELMRMAYNIALYHHERWDGSGYPRKLVGADIPLEARIVAVADVFDALTSSRPYKKAWAIDKACQYLRNSVGTHFDPEIVEGFLSRLPDVIGVYNQYSDSLASPMAERDDYWENCMEKFPSQKA